MVDLFYSLGLEYVNLYCVCFFTYNLLQSILFMQYINLERCTKEDSESTKREIEEITKCSPID